MSYITSIEKAIIVFPFIALLFTIPFVLHQYHKYGSIHKLRVLIIYSLILYLISIYFLVILPLPKMDTVVYKPGMVRLLPFQFISDFIQETSFIWNQPNTYLKTLTDPCFYTVIFNVFMFVPFGMYLRYYFKCDMKHTIWYSFLLSLFFEMTQLTGLYFIYPYPYRIFDVDDLLINTVGGILGYLFVGLFSFLPTRDKIDEESRKVGESVSGFRRITVFALDFVIYSMMSSFLFLFGISKSSFLLFIIYYGLIPMFTHGKTFGSQFLNVVFLVPNFHFFRILLRHVIIYLYYFCVPIGILFGMISFVTRFSMTPFRSISICFLGLFVVFLFYIINLIWIFQHKKRFYDSIVQVTYQSMIIRDNKNNE